MDPMDEACKRYFLSKECIMIDNEITGTPCSNDVAYSDPIQISNDPYNSENDYSVLCEEYNPEGNFTSSVEAACAREHCRVDAYFLREFNENESTLDVEFDGFLGFDGSTSCRVNVPIEAASSSKQCCSSYPDRFPFKINGGSRACCESVTYSTFMLDCCIDGTTRLIGTC